MKTLRDVQSYCGGEIIKTYAYGIDKDREFLELILAEEPSIDVWNTLHEHNYIVHKNIMHGMVDGEMKHKIIWEVQHRDVSLIEFV